MSVTNSQYKFVDFEEYCKKCEHKDLDEVKDPCNECLDTAARENTAKPVNFTARK